MAENPTGSSAAEAEPPKPQNVVAGVPSEPATAEAERATEAPVPSGPSLRERLMERVGQARDTLLGTQSLKADLVHTGRAALSVAGDVLPTAHLPALGKLVRLHPIDAVKEEARQLKKTAGDVVDLALSATRTTGKTAVEGATLAVTAPVKAVRGAARMTASATRATVNAAGTAIAAPFRGAYRAGAWVVNSPLRVWNAMGKGIDRLYAGLGQLIQNPVTAAPGLASAPAPA